MRKIRAVLNAYDAIEAWRNAQRSLNPEALSRFYSQHPDIVKFMELIWSLQDAASE